VTSLGLVLFVCDLCIVYPFLKIGNCFYASLAVMIAVDETKDEWVEKTFKNVIMDLRRKLHNHLNSMDTLPSNIISCEGFDQDVFFESLLAYKDFGAVSDGLITQALGFFKRHAALFEDDGKCYKIFGLDPNLEIDKVVNETFGLRLQEEHFDMWLTAEQCSKLCANNPELLAVIIEERRANELQNRVENERSTYIALNQNDDIEKAAFDNKMKELKKIEEDIMNEAEKQSSIFVRCVASYKFNNFIYMAFL
jgi:hypothetical protein